MSGAASAKLSMTSGGCLQIESQRLQAGVEIRVRNEFSGVDGLFDRLLAPTTQRRGERAQRRRGPFVGLDGGQHRALSCSNTVLISTLTCSASIDLAGVHPRG